MVIPAGSFGWRKACYEEFHWLPWDVERVLEDYPGEADRLAASFEATARYHLEERKNAESQAHSAGSDQGFTTDEVVGDADEEDVDPNAPEGTDSRWQLT